MAVTFDPPKRKASREDRGVDFVDAKAARPAAIQGSAQKKQVTLRLDEDVLAHFRKSGSGWQSRFNAALRKTILDAG